MVRLTVRRLLDDKYRFTEMSLIFFQNLHFPAITICGMNALRRDLLNRMESLRRAFDEISPLNSKF